MFSAKKNKTVNNTRSDITDSSASTHFLSGSGSSPFIQPSLVIGAVDDPAERQADAVADHVVAGKPIYQNSFFNSGNHISAKFFTNPPKPKAIDNQAINTKAQNRVQRSGLLEEMGTEVQEKSMVQRLADASSSDIPTSFESGLNTSKGGGKALSDPVKTEMESGIGADFDNVRVHTGSDAIQMSEQIGAKAFTHGSDIYFNEGKYNPDSSSGKHLLAHELTHTVQQGRSQLVQRATEENKEYFKDENLGEIDLRGSENKFLIEKVSIPEFKLVFTNDFSNLPHKPKARENTQRSIWLTTASKSRSNISEKVKSKADAENSPKDIKDKSNNRIYFFRLKTSQKDYLIGTLDEVVNSMLIPTWNLQGKWVNYHVDHKLELQLGGTNELNNMWLLNASSNMSSGAKINNALNNRLKKLVNAGKSKGKLWENQKEPTPREIRKNDYVTVKHYNNGGGVKGDERDRYLLEEITERVKPLDGLKALTKADIEKSNLKGTSSLIRIYFRRSDEQARGWFFDVHNWKKDEETRISKPFPKRIRNIEFTELIYNQQKHPDLGVGKLKGVAFRTRNKVKLISEQPVELDLKESPSIDFGGYVPMPAFNSAVKNIEFKPLSPIKVNDLTFDSKRGLVVTGKVLPTIPFIEGADIDITIDGNGITINKTFTTDEINLPAPLDVIESTSLTISASRNRFKANGDIKFVIKNVGEGEVKASVDSKGNIKLAGDFDIASDLFDKSKVNFTYERTSEGESKYGIGGQLSVGKGKVRGLKKAEADVQYENGKLSAKGKAQPDIKGIEEIDMMLEVGKDGYKFGGKVNLAGIAPRVKKGELELVVANNAETGGLQISGGGSVEPDIPGLKGNSAITIYYDNGAILIKGTVPFTLSQTDAEGQITVGITNQVVDENNEPTGEISEGWTIFGSGSATIVLGKGIAATAEVRLEPNGDIIVSGKVGLDQSKGKPDNKEKEFEKELFKISPPPIILFAIPPIGASLKLGIEGGAKLYAYFTPPYFKELSIGLEEFNLTNPDDNFEILGNITIGMSGRGGLTAYLTLKATLSVLVAAVEGRLTGDVGLEAKADAAASFGARWSKANGLEIEEGLIDIKADAHFIAKLTGGIRVYLDLWLAEIDVWEEDLDIASVEFGPSINVGFGLPVSMENGELKAKDPNKDSFKYPDISNTQKQQELIKDAASQDEKVKPPPPPSKEEAVRAVRRLDAGPIDMWNILTMDADEARARVSLGWVTRDTYIMWLKTKHSKIDWSDAIAVGRQRDRRDFNRFRTDFLSSEWSDFQQMVKVASFKKEHYLFTMYNRSELMGLFNEKREQKEE